VSEAMLTRMITIMLIIVPTELSRFHDRCARGARS
jgi:hypothetical protein